MTHSTKTVYISYYPSPRDGIAIMHQNRLGKGRLVPTGKWEPSIDVSYRISQQLVETTDSNGSFLRQKPVVHSIAAEAGQHIALGDFDLLVGDELVRLKHVANDPEWLVLSSNAAAICS
jgi:hypothetical protein